VINLRKWASRIFVLVSLNNPNIGRFLLNSLNVPDRWKAQLVSNAKWTVTKEVNLPNGDRFLIKINGEHDEFFSFAFTDVLKWEESSLDCWIKYLKPGFVAVDIGAYIGTYSILAARHGVDVYAFEPNPFIYRDLVENLEINQVIKRVKAMNIGISNVNADSNLEIGQQRRGSGSVISSAKSDTSLSIHLSKLDDIMPADVPISIMKIDTEGTELDIIKGASKLIAKWRPALIIESLDEFHQTNIAEYLRQFQYTFEKLKGTHNFCYSFTQ
jgi:FkbM family methyltransferase